jgi:lia operon protein LiaG
MKTMKIGILSILLLSTIGLASAQEYKAAVQNTKDTRLILKDFNGLLPIEGYAGNEIIITSTEGKLEIPEKAKGLKAIYPSGSDNTGIGLDVQKNGNQVIVTCLIPFTRNGEYKVKVPDNVAIEITSGCERSNNISVSDLKGEIDVKNCQDITLKNVSGPLVLSTIGGNIDVTFGSLNSEKPFSVNSISGDVDITLPAKTGTNLEMHTVNGGIYSDFDFAEMQKDLKRVGGNNMSFPLNGGGFKFSITTVSGNIYLRKGN